MKGRERIRKQHLPLRDAPSPSPCATPTLRRTAMASRSQHPPDDIAALRHAAFRYLARFGFAKKARMLGVRVGGLEHAEPDLSEPSPTARLLVTARGFSAGREAMRALRSTVPQALIQGTSFRGIFLVEAATQDTLALAERVIAGAGPRVGRVLAVLAEVATERPAIEEAALAVARRHLAADDSFCFRLHKRGPHGL